MGGCESINIKTVLKECVLLSEIRVPRSLGPFHIRVKEGDERVEDVEQMVDNARHLRM